MSEFTVECRTDLQRGMIPIRFGWKGRMCTVSELIDCWDGDDDVYFRVRADDEATYILRHSRSLSRWEIHFFRTNDQA